MFHLLSCWTPKTKTNSNDLDRTNWGKSRASFQLLPTHDAPACPLKWPPSCTGAMAVSLLSQQHTCGSIATAKLELKTNQSTVSSHVATHLETIPLNIYIYMYMAFLCFWHIHISVIRVCFLYPIQSPSRRSRAASNAAAPPELSISIQNFADRITKMIQKWHFDVSISLQSAHGLKLVWHWLTLTCLRCCLFIFDLTWVESI